MGAFQPEAGPVSVSKFRSRLAQCLCPRGLPFLGAGASPRAGDCVLPSAELESSGARGGWFVVLPVPSLKAASTIRWNHLCFATTHTHVCQPWGCQTRWGEGLSASGLPLHPRL